MSKRYLSLIALVVPTAMAIACSSAPAPESSGGKSASKGDDDDNSNSSAETASTTPAATATVIPTATATAIPLDAGYDAAKSPTPVGTVPGPTTQFCAQLSKCCGTLGTFNALACTGTAIAGNEDACAAEMVVCKAGGINIGGDDDDNNGDDDDNGFFF